MIYLVSPSHRVHYTALMTDMFRARHKLYVEGRKWRELAKADGLEKDQFDGDDSVYFLSLGKSRELQGGLRFIPTTSPHMLADIFPELCMDGETPRGPKIWEMSRVFVNHSSTHDANGLIIKGKLMCGMFEYAEKAGIEEIVGVTDSYFLPRLLELGIDVRPLGIPRPYESGEMIAIAMRIDETTVAKARKSYKIPHPVLIDEFCDETSLISGVSDVQIEAELGMIPYKLRAQYIAEFTEIVMGLGSGDARIVSRAERELDDLIGRVRGEFVREWNNSSMVDYTLQ